MNDYNKGEPPVDRERLVDVLSKNNSRQHNSYLYYTEFLMIVQGETFDDSEPENLKLQTAWELTEDNW
jgi:ferritin-like protein